VWPGLGCRKHREPTFDASVAPRDPKSRRPTYSEAHMTMIHDLLKTHSMTPEEAAAMEATSYEVAEKNSPPPAATREEPKDTESLPEWAVWPADLKIPPGREVTFLRFRARWTAKPKGQDRQCIVWALSDADEKLAIQRARGESARSIAELTKQTVRGIDGKRTDWSQRDPSASPERFWDEIGPKGRMMLQNYYMKTHSLTQEDQLDFFENCIAVTTAEVIS